jgi:hypothetical protein
MLDYAANGVVHWPLETIRASFVRTCATASVDPDQAVLDFVGNDSEPRQFWQRVVANLAAGRIRLVFVADAIPPELRRIVEFLNEQMDPAEVLAIEIRQFVRGDLRTLVPSVIGQTTQAEARKTGSQGEWDEASFLKKLEERGDRVGQQVLREVLEWAVRHRLRLWWGRGSFDGSVLPGISHRGIEYWPIALRTGTRQAHVQVQFAPLKNRPPFDEPVRREEMRARLNRIADVNLPPESIERYPGIPMAVFAKQDARRQLIATLDWVVDQIKSAASPAGTQTQA